MRGVGGGSMQGLATAPAPQHLQALARANKVRLARAELKRQVAEGELSVADVIQPMPTTAISAYSIIGVRANEAIMK